LTGREVLARMRRGDLPTIKGGYSEKSVFEDGAVASNDVMRRLRKLGLADPPQHTSVHCPWTLPGQPCPNHKEPR